MLVTTRRRRHAFSRAIVVALAAGMVLSGCGRPSPEADDRADGAAVPVSGLEGVAAAAGDALAPLGREALMARALAALGCPLSVSGFSLTCEPYRRWLDDLAGAHADALLVELLESPSVGRRNLAAAGLLRRGDGYRTDAGLALRVLEAASRERDPSVTHVLGAVVARLDPAASEPVREGMLGLLRSHPEPSLRAGLAGDLLPVQGPPLFDPVRTAAISDPSPLVRLAALASFWIGGAGRSEEVCTLWQDHLGDADPRIAEKAAYLMAFWGHCASHLEALLAEAGARAAGGRMTAAWFASVEALATAADATPAQRDAAVAVARTTAQTRANGWPARSRALDLVVKLDPDGAAFAERLRADDEGAGAGGAGAETHGSVEGEGASPEAVSPTEVP